MIGLSINPTTLQVGKTGTLNNHPATVVGRAVLQSTEGYRWHEYYVELADGRMILLVWEAGVWKRFEEFTPNKPFTAADAESYRVGDFARISGDSAQVKYQSTSRVVFSEGKTWDGVRMGSAARYFNAESSGNLIVVSWTGSEIEFFRGRPLSRFAISQAFNLREPSFARKLIWGGSGSAAAPREPGEVHPLWAFVIIAATVLICLWPLYAPDAGPAVVDPPPVAAPPALVLADDRQGAVAGERFTIRGHAQVEIDEPGRRFQRYEYELADDHGGSALLIEDLLGNPHQWTLFHRVSAPDWLTPTLAASALPGSPFQLERYRDAKVQRLLLTRPRVATGTMANYPTARAIQYGFLARSGDAWILVRWNDSDVELQEGHNIPEAEVLSAFVPAPSRHP